jgi:hypothetical protein
LLGGAYHSSRRQINRIRIVFRSAVEGHAMPVVPLVIVRCTLFVVSMCVATYLNVNMGMGVMIVLLNCRHFCVRMRHRSQLAGYETHRGEHGHKATEHKWLPAPSLRRKLRTGNLDKTVQPLRISSATVTKLSTSREYCFQAVGPGDHEDAPLSGRPVALIVGLESINNLT